MFTKPLSDIAALAAKFTQSASQPEASTQEIVPTAAQPTFDQLYYTTLAEIAEVPVADISDEDTLREDLALDSLDMIELVMICEKDFQILISDRTWMKVETVGEMKAIVADLIPRKMQAEEGPTGSVEPVAA